MATSTLQTPIAARTLSWFGAFPAALETRLETERERLPLWLPVALGAGIALWFALPTMAQWIGLLCAFSGGAACGLAIGWQTRVGRALTIGCGVAAAGLLLIWGRALWVEAPVLARPVTTEFSARVEAAEPLPARAQLRLVVRPLARPDLPPRLRLTLRGDQRRPIVPGTMIGVRARLMPPPTASLPGGYDFAQRAWFDRIGAVGTVLGDVILPPGAEQARQPLRARLSEHIHRQVAGSPGGVASALVTGDRGAITPEDEEAMRRSGLAHLLSISGLHVTAVVGFAMLLAMRLLALSRRLALAGYVLPLAAAAGALAGGGYTWLAGAEVPTLRSLIAALLVLAAILLGREAITLRLVAAGALLVLLWRPEALVGPSFQLSFAAVTAIVALHESRAMQRFVARREEPFAFRFGRGVAGLLITGIVVEVALSPIALFHFHKAGLYGALANVVAIPLTTFVIMPAEALALLFDAVGAGAPFWWVADHALRLLIGLAHQVAGMAVLLAQPRPDLLVTGDGRHIAAAVPGGGYAMLRDRAGDFVRDAMAEAAGIDTPLVALGDLDHVGCNRDFCRWTQGRGDAPRVILAAHGRDRIAGEEMAAACAAADVVISERWLPRECVARWLTIDRDTLEESGGLALYLGAKPRLVSALRAGDAHPWRRPHQLSGNDEAVPTADLAP